MENREILLCENCFDFLGDFIEKVSYILIDDVSNKRKLIIALKYYCELLASEIEQGGKNEL